MMKRLIAVAALAALAKPVFAVEMDKPFEQIDIDRALPNIVFGAPAPTASAWSSDSNFVAPAP